MDIDTGLFQLVTLALLGVTLLVLVVTLMSLNKLSKKLEGMGTSGAHSLGTSHARADDQDEYAHHDEPAHYGEPEAAEDDSPPATAQHPAAGAEEPAPETVGATPATASQTPAGYEQLGEPAQEAPEAAPAAVQAPEEEPEPTPTHQEPAPVVEPAPASTGFEDAPEEQPFERDGRWWFKRGDEILVYDEQTGQWGPAPVAASGQEASPPTGGDASWGQAQGGGQAQGDWGQSEQTQGWGQAETGQQQGEAAPASTFWKCPSCGAINGATATACRMCFTPKA